MATVCLDLSPVDSAGFLGEEKEWLIAYCHRKLETLDIDYFIFGHRHLPIDYTLKNGQSRYINLGDWLYLNFCPASSGTNLESLLCENERGNGLRNGAPETPY